MKKLILLIVVLLFFLTDSISQVIPYEKTYGIDSLNLSAMVIEETNDGGFLLAGASISYDTSGIPIENYYYRIFLVKTNNAGDTIWTKNIPGIYPQHVTDLIEYNDSTITLIGEIQAYPMCDGFFVAIPGNNLMIIKLSKNGDIIWTKQHLIDCNQYVMGSVKLDDGSIMVCVSDGHEFSALFNPVHQYSIHRIDQNGNILLTKTFDQTFLNYWSAISSGSFIQTEDSTFVLLSAKKIGTNLNLILIKTDFQGDTLWTKVISDSLYINPIKAIRIYGNDLLLAGGGGVFYKVDSVGNLKWRKKYNIQTKDIIQNQDSSFLILSNSTLDTNQGYDINVTYLSFNGDSIWTKSYGNINNDYASKIINIGNETYVGFGTQDCCNYKSNPSRYYIFTDTIQTNLTYINKLHVQQVKNNKIYPNPANNSVTIDYKLPDNSENAFIDIYNIMGEVVITQQLENENKKININLSELSNGLYLFIFVVNNNIVSTEKLLIIKEGNK